RAFRAASRPEHQLRERDSAAESRPSTGVGAEVDPRGRGARVATDPPLRDSSFVRPGTPAATEERESRARRSSSWRLWLLGRPLATADAAHEAIGKAVGLAVFSSDALSSTAYATQEILAILAPPGASALQLAFPIAIAIAVLLALVTISYEQTLHAYPGGGGAYIVSRDNLGELAAQVAGASLLMDYILTVAVSVSS